MNDSKGSSLFTVGQQSFPDAEPLSTRGSTCQCYRVRLYGKQHFLKKLKPHLRTDPRYVAALRKEFETGYNLDHPNLVRYISRTEDGILMDYVDGETLGDFISRHPDFFKDKGNTDSILLQLLNVVGYLHQHQIIHLDLKPSNILITRIGHDVKLTDLGFCYTDIYTDTGGYTEGYAAPEQINDTVLPDARTDIYAIGKILQQLPCANRYTKIINRCTEENPDKRYSSVEEIERELSRNHTVLWPWVTALAFIGAITLVFLLSKGNTAESSINQDIEEAKVLVDSTQKDTKAINSNEQTMAEMQVSPQTQENPASVGNAVAPPVEVSATVVNNYVSKEPRVSSGNINTLRKELRELCLPTFNKQLAAYRDSSYQSVGFMKYNRLASKFQATVRPLYMDLWERKYKSVGLFSESEFYTECANTNIYYIDNLYYDMMRNDEGNKYADSTYHYPGNR